MIEKKIKFHNRIGTKLFLLTFAVIVITVTVTATTQHLGTRKIIDDALKSNALAAMNAIHNKIALMERDSLDITHAMAADKSVLYAVESGSVDTIRQAIINVVLNERSNVEFVTVADKQGTVLARSHSDKTGDSVAAHRNFVGAQSGKTASYVETGTAVKLSVISSAPIKNGQGEIIGTVAMGYQLDKTDFIDELKAMTGADITIFLGDERINTTLITDGKRQTGTKLDPEVAGIVLNQQQDYGAIIEIFNKPFYAVYNPIITDGEAVGIYFAGLDISSVKEAEAAAFVREFSIVIIVTIVMLLINFLISRRMIIKPVLKLSSETRELANGNLNVNLRSGFFNDEIGQLGESVLYVAGLLRNLLLEMENMAHKHNAGDIDIVINESDYHGAYRDVATGTNAMVRSYIQHMNDFCTVLQSFGEGDFNAEFTELPGKKHLANEVIDEVRNKLRAINREIDTLAAEALEGKLGRRSDTEGFSGDWMKLLISLNSMMDAVIAPINEASVVLGKMAEGRLNNRIEGDYKGDFEIVKLFVNKTQQAISSYINEISNTLSEMSSHNLNVGISREYIGDFSVIRDSINHIIDSFNKVLAGINTSAEQVASGARHISESGFALSQGAAEQADAVEELNAVIGQVALQTEKNTRTAQKANDIAQNARTRAEEETAIMESMLKAMKEIDESSANIARVMQAIDDIAFQTDLLALNASVEAARAGEHGKGFAVVAEEVRTLASRSKQAASETETLIQTSRQKVEEGVITANKTAEGLEAIVNMISEITGYVKDIANASAEQYDNIGQVNTGILQVSQVTQSNTAISKESVSAAEELSSLAEILRSAAADFKLKK